MNWFLSTLIFVILSTVTSLSISDTFTTGVNSAVKNTAIGELIAEAKNSNPETAEMIEKLLAIRSIATSGASTLDAVWPGSIASAGIIQLLDQHKEQIEKRMMRITKLDAQGFIKKPSDFNVDRETAFCERLIKKEAVDDCIEILKDLNKYKNQKGFEKLNNTLVGQFWWILSTSAIDRLIRQAGEIKVNEHDRKVSKTDNVTNDIFVSQNISSPVKQKKVESEATSCHLLRKNYDVFWKKYKQNAGVLNCQVKGNTSGCARNTEGCRTGMLPKNVFHDKYCKIKEYPTCAEGFYKNYISCVKGCNDAYRNTKQSIRDLTTCGTQCLNTAETGVKSCR